MQPGGRFLSWFVLCLLPLLTAGCGSGGGGSTTATTTTVSYTIGGTVTGLNGILVLQNNGGDDLQITSDGSFTFATAIADGSTYSVTVKTQPDGQTCYVKNGSGTVSGSDVTNVVVECFDSGSLDTSFGSSGIVRKSGIAGGSGGNAGRAIAVDSSGRILVTGYSQKGGTDSDMFVLRYDSGGNPDTNFGTNGVAIYDGGSSDSGYSITLDSSARILVTGSGRTSDLVILRYDTDGTPDTSFDMDGVVVYDGLYTDLGKSIAVDSSGRILVAGFSHNGSNNDIILLRYDSDGNLDTTFGTNGKVIYSSGGSEWGNSIVLDSSGRILVTGVSGSDIIVLRYNSDGSLDTTFGTNGKVTYDSGGNDEGRAIAIDSNGRILVTGVSGPDIIVLRYDSDGSLDTTFGTGGKVVYDSGSSDTAYSMVLDSNDRIVVAGSSYNPGTGGYDMVILRYKSDGSLDTTFGTNGAVVYDSGEGWDEAYSVTTDSDGKILVAGYIKNDMAIWRYIP